MIAGVLLAASFVSVAATTQAWLPWEPLGGKLGSVPVTVSSGGSVVDTFMQGTDLAVWDRWYDGVAWHWTDLGGQTTVAPAAANLPSQSGQIDVYERDISGSLLWAACTNGVCNSWARYIGGQLAAEPSATRWPSEEHAYVEGTDHRLWQWRYGGNTPPFSGAWADLGGELAGAPAPVATSSGDIVFVRGADLRLWYWSASTGKWTDAGGVLADKPSAVTTNGSADAFVHGTDGALWHFSTATGWEPIGGRMAGFPAAVAPGGGGAIFDVFVEGTDLALWHATLAPGSSSWQWEPLFGRLDGSPSAVTWTVNMTRELDVFVRGTDGALWHRALR